MPISNILGRLQFWDSTLRPWNVIPQYENGVANDEEVDQQPRHPSSN